MKSDAIWVKARACDPPHGVTHPDKMFLLYRQFHKHGWAENEPALVGYEIDRRIQLLSGSHRWEAARLADIYIPVVITPYATVKQSHGDLTAWQQLMESGQ